MVKRRKVKGSQVPAIPDKNLEIVPYSVSTQPTTSIQKNVTETTSTNSSFQLFVTPKDSTTPTTVSPEFDLPVTGQAQLFQTVEAVLKVSSDFTSEMLNSNETPSKTTAETTTSGSTTTAAPTTTATSTTTKATPTVHVEPFKQQIDPTAKEIFELKQSSFQKKQFAKRRDDFEPALLESTRSNTFKPFPAINTLSFGSSSPHVNAVVKTNEQKSSGFDPNAFLDMYYRGGWNATDVKSQAQLTTSGQSNFEEDSVMTTATATATTNFKARGENHFSSISEKEAQPEVSHNFEELSPNENVNENIDRNDESRIDDDGKKEEKFDDVMPDFLRFAIPMPHSVPPHLTTNLLQPSYARARFAY